MPEPIVKLGPISHIGIVVEDAEKAAAFYEETFGLGPFETKLYDMREAPYFLVNGVQDPAVFKASIAFSGSVFIELVEVVEGETAHTDFLRKRGEGLQHLAFSVVNGKQIVKDLAPRGIQPIIEYEFETVFDGKPVHVYEVYLDTAKQTGGTTIQLLEMTPA